MTVKFDATPQEIENVNAIVGRIVPKICVDTGMDAEDLSLSTRMDLIATYANGCPMDFDRMRKADDFNILHDITGIKNHLNRETGQLEGMFLPRFAKGAGA
ncbi:hypothetical protein HK16_04960 [Acetobacter senegalensis]|uniref:DUF6874 domain-containing protein n=2 Tax=Acetobacter TaxID=434 RepID=A0A252EDG6_9PROT|nr:MULTISPECIES: hypothetical protein [Acetobacter]ATJ91575.1 hypothetical protein CIW82_13595 [Acetobacter tropicalis]OUL64510.1 hypothetical protein HK16_04960 [Acetobacter senegalensis]